MKIVFLFLIAMALAGTTFSQVDGDSCAIAPTAVAGIDGIDKKGMLSIDDLSRVKKLAAADKDITLLRFTYSIDCDGCDMYVQDVYGDSFPAEELKKLQAMRPMQVLSFECIVGKNKKGELVTCKPFLFYIRP